MKRLTKEQVLMLHRELIRKTGGADGLRDELSDLILQVASGESSFEDMVKWIVNHQI